MSDFPGDQAGNPFPGLRAFGEEEEHLFFGRERQADDLLQKLSDYRFLAVIGSSGSGKSSLVKSGLMPGLFRGFMTGAGSAWSIALMRPGSDPVGNLAAALSAPGVLSADDDTDGSRRMITESVLRRGRSGLTDAVKQLRNGQDNILIVVDQFEELFRYSRYEKESKKSGRDTLTFVSLLLEAAAQTDVPVYVIITMRSDFLASCTEFRGLPEAINKGLYLIPRMTRDDIRQAITGPVAVGGATISPLLVTQLLNDVGDSPDQLPILQHALMRTWQCWQQERKPGEPLQLKHYETIGTMKNALSLHAEEAYHALGTDKLKRVCEYVFKSLTEKRPNTPGTRRPSQLSELAAIAGATTEEVKQVIEAFRTPERSFLVPPWPSPLQPDTIVDISHESLMRVWERLAAWVEEEAESAKIYLNLLNAARLHAENKAGFYRSPELDFALRWRKENAPNAAWGAKFNDQYALAISFLDKSEAARQEAIKRQEKRKKRKQKRLIFFSALAVLLLCAISAGSTYLVEEEYKKQAAEQARQLEIYRSRAFKALNMADHEESPQIMLMAATLSLGAQRDMDSIYKTILGTGFTHYFDGVNYMALDKIFWHEGHSHFTPGDTIDTIHALVAFRKSPAAICFTSDSLYKLAFSYDKQFSFSREATAFPNSIRMLAMSPGDRWLAAADSMGGLFVFDPNKNPGNPKQVIASSTGTIHAISFSGENALHVIRETDHSFWFETYDIPTFKLKGRHGKPFEAASIAVLDDDYAAVAESNRVSVWQIGGGKEPVKISEITRSKYGAQAQATALALNKANGWVAWGDTLGHVFGVETGGDHPGRQMPRIEHSNAIVSLYFVTMRDGNLFLATGGYDGQASLGDARGAKDNKSSKDLLIVNSYDNEADFLSSGSDSNLLLIQSASSVQFHILDLDLLIESVEHIRKGLGE
ncbi:MAG: hypothetical protein FD123_3818 [Bacteroidetes bacterium]|nr:MAG: hypothetical protein FD123_3818 [Bacteroidota bacterium]